MRPASLAAFRRLLTGVENLVGFPPGALERLIRL